MPLDIKDSNEIISARSLPAQELESDPLLKAQLAALPGQIAAIEPIILDAVARLDALNAWPSHDFTPYYIELNFGAEIETKWGAINVAGQSKARSIAINATNPLRISIGVELPTNPYILGLLNQTNLQLIDVFVLLLGHEIFHLTEADNMSQCQIPFGRTKSGFAIAVHPDFSDPWRIAMHALAENFWGYRAKNNPHIPKNTLAIWKSGDIASEACADMFALRLMPQTQHAIWITALILERQQQELTGAATLVDASNLAAVNPAYQIGAVLANQAPLLIGKDQWTIRETMWREAFNAALLEKNYLIPETRDKITLALISPARKPPVPETSSFWEKIASKLKR